MATSTVRLSGYFTQKIVMLIMCVWEFTLPAFQPFNPPLLLPLNSLLPLTPAAGRL